MSVLIVVAHPDDEVLGCGATASWLAAQGHTVRTCMLSSDVAARRARPDIDELRDDIRRAQATLGLGEPILGSFPNIKFNSVPHLELVQVIEAALLETGADIVFTHHPCDLNDDHRHTSRACQAAVRLGQRGGEVPPLRALYFMEILSSTEWGFGDTTGQFRAESFFEIGAELMEKKLEALRCYSGVMREYPHPRSEEGIRALATLRGSQAGIQLAEAFQAPFKVLRSADFD